MTSQPAFEMRSADGGAGARRFILPLACLLMLGLGACQTTRSSDPEPMPAHPAAPVQASPLAPPVPRQPAGTEVAQLPAPDPADPAAAMSADAPDAAAPQGSAVQEETDGPVRIHDAAAVTVASRDGASRTETQTVRVSSSNERWEFLNWFGAANTANRAANPAASLRLARDLPASRQSESTQQAAYPVMVGEGGRLRPTFTDALPTPGGADPIATGSVRQPSEQDDPVSPRLEETPPQSIAATAPASEPETPAHWSAPRRTHPSTLRFSPGQVSLDATHRAELVRVAEARLMDGGKIHVYGIARGVNGDRGRSAERVRRLVDRTGQVARHLREQGIHSGDIEIRISEEQVSAGSQADADAPDVDRIEVFIE